MALGQTYPFTQLFLGKALCYPSRFDACGDVFDCRAHEYVSAYVDRRLYVLAYTITRENGKKNMQKHIWLALHMSLHIMFGDWRTENPSSRHFAEPLPAFYRSVDDRAFAQRPADQSGAPTAAMRPNSGRAGSP